MIRVLLVAVGAFTMLGGVLHLVGHRNAGELAFGTLLVAVGGILALTGAMGQ